MLLELQEELIYSSNYTIQFNNEGILSKSDYKTSFILIQRPDAGPTNEENDRKISPMNKDANVLYKYLQTKFKHTLKRIIRPDLVSFI